MGTLRILVGALVSAYALATVPSHEQALINALAGESDTERVEAAQTLARRKSDGLINPHTEARIRELYHEHPDFVVRAAAGFYFGESIKGPNSDEDWAWLLEEFRNQRDPAMRMILAHDLGEVAHIQPNKSGFTLRQIRLRVLEYSNACRQLLARQTLGNAPAR